MLDNEKSLLKSQTSHAADAYIRGANGLRGAAATAFSQVARRFASAVVVRWEGQVVDAKSAIDLARLNIGPDQVIRIITRGEDAEIALTALEQAVMDGLDSDEDPFEAEAMESLEDGLDVRKGSPAAAGLAIASAFVWNPAEVSVNSLSEGYHKERNKFLSALITARQELQKLIAETSAYSASLLAPLFAEQLSQLDDPELLEDTDHEIRRGLSASEAFAKVVQDHGSVHELEVRVLNILSGSGSQARLRSLPPSPIILVTASLSPSDYILLDPDRVAGVVIETDLSRSIALKLLKSRGIPCVSHLGASVSPIQSGQPLIVDGDSGLVVVKPDAYAYRTARNLMRSRVEKKAREKIVARQAKREESPAFLSHSVEHFTAAARIAAELDVPTFELKADRPRAGAESGLSDEVAIDPGRSPTGAPPARKRKMWEILLGRK